MSIVNGYCTLAEIKAEVGIPTGDTQDDALLEIAVESASRLVDAYCNRRFWQDGSAVARYYTTTDWQTIDIDGLATTTGLVVKTDDDDDGVYETTWTLNTDYSLEPANAAADGLPYTRIVVSDTGSKAFPTSNRGVEVTAQYGWAAVPLTVKQATLIQAARLFKRKDSPYGVAGSPDMGNEMRLLAKLDPDVQVLLTPFKRYVIA